MFSRAAKSVVKSFGSRRIHIGEKNFKIALIDGAGEISQTLSQLLRNSAKLNTVALYDVTVVNKPLPNFYNEQPFEQPIPSEMLTTAKKSCSGEDGSTAVRQTENSIRNRIVTENNHQGNDGRNQIEKLVEALYRLPIAEEVPAFNSPLIPIEELMPKAGNACGRMRLYGTILGKRGFSGMKTWQRDYTTLVIPKWFLDLTHPSFRKYDLSFIPEAKIAKKDRPIKKTKKIGYSSRSALILAKESNHQSLSTSLLNHGEKPARRLMKKFKNVRGPPNIEAYRRAVEKPTDWMISAALSNNKLGLLREIYNRIKFPLSSLNFINEKHESNREVVSFNRDSETMMNDTLNVVERENWIQRTCSKIKSILPELHAKIRTRSTTASDSHCSENIFTVSQMIPLSDIISDRAILFASKKDYKDDRPKGSIRKKIQEFCMQRKRTLNKIRGKNDICEKRERRSQKREEICGKGRPDCSERRKRTGKRQTVISCKERKSSRDCRKTCERKAEIQEDPCKPKRDDTSRRVDPCKPRKSSRYCREIREREAEIQEDPCKPKRDDTFRTEERCKTRKSSRDCRKTCERKAEIEEDPCKPKKDDISRTEEDPCRESSRDYRKTCEGKAEIQEDPCKKRDDTFRTEEDSCRGQRPVKQEETFYKLHDSNPCRLDKKEEITKTEEIKKKEEIKKPDCTEIKKVEPCEKKPCPTVKKAPECSEDDTKGKGS